jgi:hypothetical protein
MSSAAEQFESDCLESTLRTLRLTSHDLLDNNDDRLPPNDNDRLLHMARPTWIGRDYNIRGVLLLAKNPRRSGTHPLDPILADALEQLTQTIASYRRWRDVQFDVMSDRNNGWLIWRVSVVAVVRALGVSEHSIAFGNLVPFRTADNEITPTEMERGWWQDIGHVFRLLNPLLIVDMAGGLPKSYRQRCSGAEVLRFRRMYGDRGVTGLGQTDLETLRRWGDSHRSELG